VLALERDEARDLTVNIGSGIAHHVLGVAERLAEVTGRQQIQAQITGRYRVGDIRHCFADIRRATDVLSYSPRVLFDDGLVELADWLESQEAVDHVVHACRQLEQRGLTL
jgi:dTDP-L-rhamnose 4-epimerase